MRIAVTGGSGFVGGHLAASLAHDGHDVVLVARGHDVRPWAVHLASALAGCTRVRASVADAGALADAFRGCDAVAHCAGINRELGRQTYDAVHVRGTATVLSAAERCGVARLVLVSFLRARPACGSAYHESKWAAEELVRASSLDWTVVKPGMMYGVGDHMLDHLSHALCTFPVFVGIGPRPVRPLAIDDAVAILTAVLVDGALRRATVPVVGPTELTFDDAARLVASVLGRRRRFVRAPLAFHALLARVAERVMEVPLVSVAQVRMLREGVVEPRCAPDALPVGLAPRTPFDEASICGRLPEPGPFTWRDLKAPW